MRKDEERVEGSESEWVSVWERERLIERRKKERDRGERNWMIWKREENDI